MPHKNNEPYFEIVGTLEGNYYLDYIVKRTYSEECGEYAVAFEMTQQEQDDMFTLFKKKYNLELERKQLVRVVYCWYNCCEPPEAYDLDPLKQFERM